MDRMARASGRCLRSYSRAKPHVIIRASMQETAKRLVAAFRTLEQTSHPIGAKRLRGELEGIWRLRVGGLRVIYEPPNEADEIHIVKIVTRGDAY